MKISAAGLLIAFAGFLQESKCMYHSGAAATNSTSASTSAAAISATIVVTWTNLHPFTALLHQTHNQPSWATNPPRGNFQHYDVYFRTFTQGDFEGRLNFEPQGTSVELPTSADIWVGSKKYMGSEGFHPYEIEVAIMCLRGRDVIFITIPETREIYHEVLLRNGDHETHKQFEERVQKMRATYARLLQGPDRDIQMP